MNSVAATQRTKSNIPMILVASSLAAGILLRWYMTYVIYPPEEAIFSDMHGYVSVARQLLLHTHRFNPFDMVQGFGTPALLALCIKVGGSLTLAKLVWWLCSTLTPVSWTAAAYFMPVKSLAPASKSWLVALVAFLTSFDISHAMSATVFMPESPFALLVAVGVALLMYSLDRKRTHARSASVLAGILWAIALTFRGHGIILLFSCAMITFGLIALMLRARFASGVQTKKVKIATPVQSIGPACLAMLLTMILIGLSFKVTIGRFAVSALSGATNVLIGHVYEAKEVRFEPPGKNMYHAYGSPAVHQRMPTASYTFPFSVIDTKNALVAIKNLFWNDPSQFILLCFKNAWQSFAGNYPWPANVMPLQKWLHIYESMFLMFGLFPALAGFVLGLKTRGLEQIAILFLGLQIVGLWGVSFTFLGEVRYRVPFDGAILVLASLTWMQILTARHTHAKTSK